MLLDRFESKRTQAPLTATSESPAERRRQAEDHTKVLENSIEVSDTNIEELKGAIATWTQARRRPLPSASLE